MRNEGRERTREVNISTDVRPSNDYASSGTACQYLKPPTTLIRQTLSLALLLFVHTSPSLASGHFKRLRLEIICADPAMRAMPRGTGRTTACSKHWVKSRSRDWEIGWRGHEQVEDGPREVRASKTAWKGMVMLTTGRIPKKLGVEDADLSGRFEEFEFGYSKPDIRLPTARSILTGLSS